MRICCPSIINALGMELAQRRPQYLTLLHHYDQRIQHTSDQYQQLLTDFNITSSMSDTGNCYKNTMIESFFGTLRIEGAGNVFPYHNPARSELLRK